MKYVLFFLVRCARWSFAAVCLRSWRLRAPRNNFSAIYPRQLGSLKSFYDTAVSYPSSFTASMGRKLIKANGECELQLQETRASRSRVDRRGENSALRIPQSRPSPRAYRCGNTKRDSRRRNADSLILGNGKLTTRALRVYSSVALLSTGLLMYRNDKRSRWGCTGWPPVDRNHFSKIIRGIGWRIVLPFRGYG